MLQEEHPGQLGKSTLEHLAAKGLEHLVKMEFRRQCPDLMCVEALPQEDSMLQQDPISR